MPYSHHTHTALIVTHAACARAVRLARAHCRRRSDADVPRLCHTCEQRKHTHTCTAYRTTRTLRRTHASLTCIRHDDCSPALNISSAMHTANGTATKCLASGAKYLRKCVTAKRTRMSRSLTHPANIVRVHHCAPTANTMHLVAKTQSRASQSKRHHAGRKLTCILATDALIAIDAFSASSTNGLRSYIKYLRMCAS
jgi:hypothetical protein